jgi:thiosulfate/3-mercaptopyruvate sulfurtransferase
MDADRSPLVSVERLAGWLREPQPAVVVDLRWYLGRPGDGRAAYLAGHLPGAIFLDLDTDLSAGDGPGRHPLPAPKAFRDTLEAVGIGDDDLVVAYDDASGSTAARLWWMLDDLGHARAAVLDGGLSAWVTAGHPVTTEPPVDRPRATLHLHDAWDRVIDRDAVAAGLGHVILIDGRAEPRYRGEVEPIDRIPGHIPTALNIPTQAALGPDGRVLASDQLAGMFRASGADPGDADMPVVTSCGSGVTACFNSLAMRLAGLPDPILYAGSYSDWTRAGMPIVTGPEPGDRPG